VSIVLGFLGCFYNHYGLYFVSKWAYFLVKYQSTFTRGEKPMSEKTQNEGETEETKNESPEQNKVEKKCTCPKWQGFCNCGANGSEIIDTYNLSGY
jgi:hypothetical protein